MKKQPLVIITGPTAVGKTDLSVKLAKLIGGEIISADSMQVYRMMDIGSAKIKQTEMQGVTHHLIDILNPEEEFNVYIFQKLAKQAMQEILDRGNIPIIAGGTGFYIQALLYDISFEEEHSAVRTYYENLAAEKGNGFLHDMLKEVDPVSAEEIHENNVKRVIRALEYYEINQEPISAHNQRERQKKSPYEACYFVLTDERKRIYERIDKRVDMMLEEGLVAEVTSLKEKGYHKDMVSMQGLGYKEILDYLDGNLTLEEAVYLIKRDTRHFAKRQLTWFRRERDVIWLNKREFDDSEEKMLSFMLETIKEKGIEL